MIDTVERFGDRIYIYAPSHVLANLKKEIVCDFWMMYPECMCMTVKDAYGVFQLHSTSFQDRESALLGDLFLLLSKINLKH